MRNSGTENHAEPRAIDCISDSIGLGCILHLLGSKYILDRSYFESELASRGVVLNHDAHDYEISMNLSCERL